MQAPSSSTDDTRILKRRPLTAPAILLEELPQSSDAVGRVCDARAQIGAIVNGRDDRLVVIAGPCSVHDPHAAIEYATRLTAPAARYADDLLIVMRAYFEKPRTVLGWKGFINDPFIDDSYQINQGLRMARSLLLDIGRVGIPAATEFLDTIIPQFIADLLGYAAIGARTTESQVHRELASGLSMPVGFKNGTSGNVQIAVDAVCAARHSHWFPSVTKDGVASIFETSGNEDAHVILRGGSRTGPNHGSEHVASAAALLAKAGLPQRLIVDCSHGNSGKDHARQAHVADDIATQVENGSGTIAGVMLESHLVAGRQEPASLGKLLYGQSITDACISFEQTLPILERLAAATRARRRKLRA
ncbi:MAG: 3-deoxy-7-phosphoheptulonate synthase [Puniceicoccales bacterium]|jgi:3-deoxy-7-phosphoheptulonate synthase|nr:3-deoxy-7-phosphoheptulonate synthase [Puniceicoccales bacterium]